MRVYLIDGTYELFRQFYGQPERTTEVGDVGAVRGVLASVVSLLEDGATHVGVATDHVIESFRNELFPGYKTGEGIDPVLFAQFPILEEALESMGVFVWPMVELEADDALASAAKVAGEDERVEQVVIMTPDKDLHQSVVDGTIVQYDRRNQRVIDEAGVIEKKGIRPESIPDYLALVGDTADGIPGIAGWGAKSSSVILAEYKHLEYIPREVGEWAVRVRGAGTLAANLFENWDDVLLYRDLATLRIDESLLKDVDQLQWTGPRETFTAMVQRLELDRLVPRIDALMARNAD